MSISNVSSDLQLSRRPGHSLGNEKSFAYDNMVPRNRRFSLLNDDLSGYSEVPRQVDTAMTAVAAMPETRQLPTDAASRISSSFTVPGPGPTQASTSVSDFASNVNQLFINEVSTSKDVDRSDQQFARPPSLYVITQEHHLAKHANNYNYRPAMGQCAP